MPPRQIVGGQDEALGWLASLAANGQRGEGPLTNDRPTLVTVKETAGGARQGHQDATRGIRTGALERRRNYLVELPGDFLTLSEGRARSPAQAYQFEVGRHEVGELRESYRIVRSDGRCDLEDQSRVAIVNDHTGLGVALRLERAAPSIGHVLTGGVYRRQNIVSCRTKRPRPPPLVVGSEYGREQ